MQRESQRYTGAPVSITGRVRAWLTPSGAPVMDGLRLATINVVVLLAALILLGLMTIIDRTAGWLLPLPLLLSGFFIVMLMAAVGLWIAWRYSEAHGEASRAGSKQIKPDVFGVVAALPFIVLALMLLGSGMLGIFSALVTLSGSRFSEAIGQVGYGALFAALSAGIVFVARVATD
jgi:hypothetical protein